MRSTAVTSVHENAIGSPQLLAHYFFDIFPIWGRRIEFSLSMFSSLVIFSLYSCLLHIFLCNIVTSVPVLFLLVSKQSHLFITTYFSVFPSTCPNHLRFASLIVSLMFTIQCQGSSRIVTIFMNITAYTGGRISKTAVSFFKNAVHDALGF